MKRWGHTVIAVLTYIAYTQLFYQDATSDPFLTFYVIVSITGGIFPDVDIVLWKKLGILGHRSAITHSALFPIILALYLRFDPLTLRFTEAFLVGVLTHLLADSPSGRVVGLKRFGKLWLFVNGMLCFPPVTITLAYILADLI